MATLRKDFLYPGRWRVGANADGSPRYREFTTDEIRRLVQQGNEMIAAELPVPICMEHRDDAFPQRLSADDRKSQFVAGTLTYVDRFGVDDRGVAFLEVDNADPAVAAELERIKFVSPEIDAFTDGRDRAWGNVITHVAVTNKPVQFPQEPFTRLSRVRVRLSQNDYEGTPMADEPKKDDKPKDAPKGDDKGGDGEAGGEFKALVEALKGAGLNIPDEVVDVPGLIIAVKASGGEGADPDADDEPDTGDPVAGDAAPAAPPPIALSHLQDKIIKTEREQLAARIDKLLARGQVTPVIHGDLKRRATRVRLSLNDKGDAVATDIHTEIAAYEKLPRNSAFSKKADKTRLSAGDDVREVPPPENDAADDEKCLKIWDATG